jgi:hypothetical protein
MEELAMADSYAKKLDWFKRNERPEVVLLLADNPELVRIVIAWGPAREAYQQAHRSSW